jgi:hypothetical protein
MQQTPQSAGNATVNEAGSGTLSGYRECCSLNFEERSEQSENVVIWVGKSSERSKVVSASFSSISERSVVWLTSFSRILEQSKIMTNSIFEE